MYAGVPSRLASAVRLASRSGRIERASPKSVITARADAPSLCYVLSMKRLEEISLTHPRIQLQIVRNMAQEMSNRLRRANQEFTDLMA